MGQKTKIEWTDATWSPLRVRVRQDAAAIAERLGYTSLIQIAGKMAGRVGPHCEKVSPGCKGCYACRDNHRCLPQNGTGLPFDRRARDLVQGFVDERTLMLPLRWRKPRLAFVENQSDLFGEWYTDEMRDRVFAVAQLTPHIQYQVLTKRAWDMSDYFLDARRSYLIADRCRDILKANNFSIQQWPMPNVWLGVSVEDLQRKGRIDYLRETPACVRFLSLEPLLEDIGHLDLSGIDQVIVGGESGPGSRLLNIDWIRNIVAQCKAANKLCFVKQVGARPYPGSLGNGRMPEMALKHRKGGDPKEWPPEIRVREMISREGLLLRDAEAAMQARAL